MADAIECMLKAKGVTHLAHYLDDFILIGKAGTSECQRNMQAVLKECTALGVPLARHKLEGPRYSSGYGEDGNKTSSRKAKRSQTPNQVLAVQKGHACKVETHLQRFDAVTLI